MKCDINIAFDSVYEERGGWGGPNASMQSKSEFRHDDMVVPLFTLIASAVPVAVYFAGASLYLAQPMPMAYGRWWTVLFTMVAHGSASHLWSNLLVQVLLGVFYEQLNGPLRTAVVYITAGVIGAAGQAAMYNGPSTVLVGASAAIFGLGGACVGDVVLNSEQHAYPWMWLLYAIVLTASEVYLVIQEVDSLIAREAHLMGGAAGLLVGLFISVNVRKRPWERYLQWCAVILITAFVSVVAVYFRMSVE